MQHNDPPDVTYWVIRDFNRRGWYAKVVSQATKPQRDAGRMVFGPYNDPVAANAVAGEIVDGWLKGCVSFSARLWPVGEVSHAVSV